MPTFKRRRVSRKRTPKNATDIPLADGHPLSLPMAVQGHLVGLRPIAPVDLLPLFSWRNDSRWLPPFAQRSDKFAFGGLSPSHRLLDMDEWQHTELQFLLRNGVALMVQATAGYPLGVVHVYNVNMFHGWAYYREFFPGPVAQTPEAAEATGLFLDLLFDRYRLRKLYAEMMEVDSDRRDKLLYAGFHEEMRLREDTWHVSSYVDYIYLALLLDGWRERRLIYLADLAVTRRLKGEEHGRA